MSQYSHHLTFCYAALFHHDQREYNAQKTRVSSTLLGAVVVVCACTVEEGGEEE